MWIAEHIWVICWLIFASEVITLRSASSPRHSHPVHWTINKLIIRPPAPLTVRSQVCFSPLLMSECARNCTSIREKASTFVCPYASGWRRTCWAPCWEHRWCRGLPRQRWRRPHSHMGPPAFWIPHLLFRPELTNPSPPHPHTLTFSRSLSHTYIHANTHKAKDQAAAYFTSLEEKREHNTWTSWRSHAAQSVPQCVSVSQWCKWSKCERSRIGVLSTFWLLGPNDQSQQLPQCVLCISQTVFSPTLSSFPLTFVEHSCLHVCSSPSFLFFSQPLSSPLSPLPHADAPCGSPSTWEKPHTSPDKVTNPSHFTAPSHCSLGMFKTVCMCVRVCLIGDRNEYVTQVQGGGFFFVTSSSDSHRGLQSSDWLEK